MHAHQPVLYVKFSSHQTFCKALQTTRAGESYSPEHKSWYQVVLVSKDNNAF